jgi:hypothetical protein
VLVLMFTVLTSVLMVMALGVGAMLMSVGMLVLMFMFVSLGRSMHVFMAVDMCMGMGTLHGRYSFQTVSRNSTTLS